ncbi:alkylglycerol monooxygenase-like [Eriocheir sinensis]|uniref:alkylglycerol monooxygenase-like n=1 Tax=Eriocheir sinensis TaxID=95602 RepID=UPI0021C75381|nr:alkylglycerol monooxygenase-like [Eriocheir sinensis]
MFLIVWDRMFGTFAEEREDEPITYGTVSQVDTFHPLGLQLQPYQKLYQKMQTMKTDGDRLRTLFYGPGWSPGKPRLGAEEDIPDTFGLWQSFANFGIIFSACMSLGAQYDSSY